MKALRVLPMVLAAATLSAAAQTAPRPMATKLVQAPTLTTMPADKPVVRVNGTVLTDRDLLRQMLIQFPYARMHRGFPKELEPDIRRTALKEIEFEELVYQEAQRRKMTVAPARLARAIRDFRKQFDSDEDFQNYLATELKGTEATLRERVRRAILIDDLLKLEVGNKVRITDAQLRSFYTQNKERFRRPESVSLQTISLVIPDNATPQQKTAVRQRAEAALKQAKATHNYEEFGLLAEKVSEDDWRVMMGDHKSLHRGRMPPQVEKVVFNLKPGDVTDLIETENSFCIARVNAHEQPKLVPFEQVRKDVRGELEGQKAGELRGAFETRLRQGAKIEEL